MCVRDVQLDEAPVVDWQEDIKAVKFLFVENCHTTRYSGIAQPFPKSLKFIPFRGTGGLFRLALSSTLSILKICKVNKRLNRPVLTLSFSMSP